MQNRMEKMLTKTQMQHKISFSGGDDHKSADATEFNALWLDQRRALPEKRMGRVYKEAFPPLLSKLWQVLLFARCAFLNPRRLSKWLPFVLPFHLSWSRSSR